MKKNLNMTSPLAELSVIIPTINEAQALPKLLDELSHQSDVRLELIIADGGSNDGTQQLAADHGAILSETACGRGHQMNQGAKLASAPLLLFLHADSSLTTPTLLADALKALKSAAKHLSQPRLAGHFRLRFLRTESGHDLAYRYYEEKSALNRRECTNGDQGLLLSQEFFQQLGGFDESLWFLEDQRLAETIRQQGTWITLPGELGTSARRFEQEGLGRRMVLSALIMNFHAMGLSEFFHRAGAVYHNQDRTGQLQLSPIFKLITEMNREAGRQVSRQRWLATGEYVSSHAWQPFFYLDVAMEHHFSIKHRLFLSLYDRLFHPLSRLRPLHYFSAGLTWLWFTAYRTLLTYQEKRHG